MINAQSNSGLQFFTISGTVKGQRRAHFRFAVFFVGCQITASRQLLIQWTPHQPENISLHPSLIEKVHSVMDQLILCITHPSGSLFSSNRFSPCIFDSTEQLLGKSNKSLVSVKPESIRGMERDWCPESLFSKSCLSDSCK